MHDFLHHLNRLLIAGLALESRHCGDDHENSKTNENDAHRFVEGFEETIGDDILKERCKLAFEDVHAECRKEHSGEEKVTLTQRYLTLAKHQDCHHRRPINPDEGIEKVEC